MSPAVRIASACITVYRWILSPLLGLNCRYAPSCSRYCQQALARHGLFRGGWLGCKRILRCHPWGGHGHDPVPSKTLGETR